jgi:hypothetical protein
MGRISLVAPLFVLSLTLGAEQPLPQDPRWPRVEEQLTTDSIPEGSALEALVRTNQRFDLLAPDEADDRLPYPYWLRVFWRAGHPAFRAAPGDATKGYPRVLSEILEWMLSHPDLVAGPGILAERDGEAREAAAIAVGANVRVSGEAIGPRSESDIRIDVNDPQRVIAASNNISVGGRQAQYASTDGGHSWSSVLLPLAAGDVFHSDPSVEWTSGAIAWTATLGLDGSLLESRVRVYRSTDGGRIWGLEATPSGTQTLTWVTPA